MENSHWEIETRCQNPNAVIYQLSFFTEIEDYFKLEFKQQMINSSYLFHYFVINDKLGPNQTFQDRKLVHTPVELLQEIMLRFPE